MVEENNSKPRGRPRKEESDLADYRQHSFYFPLRLDNVWKEFQLILLKKPFALGYLYPERLRSMAVRRLIFDYIAKNTTNTDLKKQMADFINSENAHMTKLKKPN